MRVHSLAFPIFAVAGTMMFCVAAVVGAVVSEAEHAHRLPQPSRVQKRAVWNALRSGEFGIEDAPTYNLMMRRATYLARCGAFALLVWSSISVGIGMALCWLYFWPSLVWIAITLQVLVGALMSVVIVSVTQQTFNSKRLIAQEARVRSVPRLSP